MFLPIADLTTTQVGVGGALALVISTSITAWSNRSGRVLKKLEEMRDELDEDRTRARRHVDRDNTRFRVIFRDTRGENGVKIYDPWPDSLEVEQEEMRRRHG